MSDEAFHEIQLSGKQLVFLFMAITVVSVVIFLCGVLVGRGVRVQQDVQMAAADADLLPPAGVPTEAGSGSAPATEAPPALEDAPPAPEPADIRRDLSYPQRLEDETPPAEKVRPTAPARAASEPRPSPPAAATKPFPTPPSGDGFTVQVAALRERDEAETIVRRLTDKGYPAYLLDPAPNAPAAVYRVRVGKYGSRRDAEQVVRRLEQEEQFKPWITR